MLAFPFLTLLLLLAAPAADDVIVSDRVVAGGPEDFMQVRHLVLKGSQEEIGAALTGLAVRDLQTRPWLSRDSGVTRVQAEYFADVWPTHHARMRGAAAAFGSRISDHGSNYSVLGYDMGDMFGCTVVYYPPNVTADGHAVLSRNLDFTSGTSTGRRPGPGRRAAMSRPFVIESYPDEGHASLFTCSMDLLGAAFDGINDKGLTVALLSDRELMNEYDMVPTKDLAVGLSEIQVPRFLLETCATVDEARDALLTVKQYYAFIPCHYIVGDRNGRAFVFEASPDRNRSFFIEKPGRPLVTTNFMHHLNPDPESAKSSGPKSSLGRYQSVCTALKSAANPYDRDAIVSAAAGAAFDGPGPQAQVPYAPNRTLWHALYVPDERSLSIDFYLGEQESGRGLEIRRSGYLEFTLESP